MINKDDQRNTFSNYKKMIALADKHWKDSDYKKYQTSMFQLKASTD